MVPARRESPDSGGAVTVQFGGFPEGRARGRGAAGGGGHGGMAMNAAGSAIARMARAGAAQYDLAKLDQEQRDHTARGNTRVDRVLNVSPVLTDPIPR